jgi:hypothetical protein
MLQMITQDRVTRSGNFSPLGRLFTLGRKSYEKNTQVVKICGLPTYLHIYWVKIIFGQKRVWATFWAIFKQTHLVTLTPRDDAILFNMRLFLSANDKSAIVSRTKRVGPTNPFKPFHYIDMYMCNISNIPLLSHACTSGLPDGLFLNQKSQFGSILEGPRLENVDIC